MRAKAWVHIPKEKREKKLAECVWEGIFVGYDETNQFRVYNPRTCKIHVSQDAIVDKSASGVTTLPSDFDPYSLWSKKDDTVLDESLNSDDSALPNPRVNDTSRTFAIEETDTAGESSRHEKDTSQNPVGERDEDREKSESILSELDSHPENDLDLPFEEVQEEPSGVLRISEQIKNPSKPAEGTIRYDPFHGLPKTMC